VVRTTIERRSLDDELDAKFIWSRAVGCDGSSPSIDNPSPITVAVISYNGNDLIRQ
jgi:hypothetical protein